MALTKFKRAIVEFGPDMTVDAYELPTGERRIGLVGASLVIGYSREWFSQVVRRRPETLKALQSEGFTGGQLEGEVTERDGKSGSSRVKTISLRDFTILVEYAAKQGKRPAIALQRAASQTGYTVMLDQAFGDSRKTSDYSTDFLAALEVELQENRQDIEDQSLPGDPPEIRNWNQSVNNLT